MSVAELVAVDSLYGQKRGIFLRGNSSGLLQILAFGYLHYTSVLPASLHEL